MGRRKKNRGDRVLDLQAEDYAQAWELFATGHGPRAIKQICRITSAQLHALYNEGLPARGSRRESLPSFQVRLAEEQAAVRMCGIEAGKVISTRGVRVLGNALENAETAQTLIMGIQRLIADNIAQAMTLPPDERPSLDSLMPGDQAIRALNAFRRIADGYEKAARAYTQIYADPPTLHPATSAVLDLPGKGKVMQGGGMATLPAALAMADDVMGEGTGDRIAEEISREIMKWSPVQREHYALTGEEPKPNDVIDVDAEDRPATDA